MNRPEVLTRAIILIDGFDPRAVMPASGPHPAFRDIDGVPAADLLLRRLSAQGITDAWLVSRNLPGLVVHYFGDGGAWGLRATHVRQDGPAGSGGAMAAARQYVTESTLLIDGALVTTVPVATLFKAHRRMDVDATMCLTASVGESAGLPRARIDRASGLVRQIFPEPPFPESEDTLCAVGAYIIEPAAALQESNAMSADWVRDALPGLAERERVGGWEADAGVTVDLPRRVRAVRLGQRPGAVRNVNV